MKVLVVGGGGREHALVWKLAQSDRVTRIYCAPGNAGTLGLATNLNMSPSDINGLATLAEHENIDLTVIGPEAPLAEGIVDAFTARGLKVFGPNAKAARLESSKAFAKELLKKYRIPTAASQEFSVYRSAREFIQNHPYPLVVKADGLAAGKGVYICHEQAEAEQALADIFQANKFGEAGSKIIIEDFLEGEEASLLVLSDSKTYVPLASAQDHKAIFDGDKGPNTGGMGAYSPAPVITDEMMEKIDRKIWRPLFQGLKREGIEYRGVLYAGLMIRDNEPLVLEFNVRFGDPEAQAILPRLRNDLSVVIEAVIAGNLAQINLDWSPQPTVCVVLASGGYPGAYDKGLLISGLEDIDDPGVTVFHAGTKIENGKTVTSGGRVLGVSASGINIKESIGNAYRAVEKISFPGKQYRKDIAQKALKRRA